MGVSIGGRLRSIRSYRRTDLRITILVPSTSLRTGLRLAVLNERRFLFGKWCVERFGEVLLGGLNNQRNI